MSNLTTTNILVLGGGTIGFEAADAWLKANDNTFVIVVDVSKETLCELPDRLELNDNAMARRLQMIIGCVSTETPLIKETVLEVLAGRPLHHIVSALGCSPTPDISLADGDVIAKTEDTCDKIFLLNLAAAHAFLPILSTKREAALQWREASWARALSGVSVSGTSTRRIHLYSPCQRSCRHEGFQRMDLVPRTTQVWFQEYEGTNFLFGWTCFCSL